MPQIKGQVELPDTDIFINQSGYLSIVQDDDYGKSIIVLDEARARVLVTQVQALIESGQIDGIASEE